MEASAGTGALDAGATHHPAGGVPAPAHSGWLAGFWEHVRFRMQELRVAIHLHGFSGLMLWLRDRFVSLLGLMVSTAVGLVISAVLAALTAWRVTKRLRRRRRQRVRIDPALAAMHVLLRRADRRLARRGLTRSQSETLHAFAMRIHREAKDGPAGGALADWYVRYAAIRYGTGSAAEKLAALTRATAGLL